MGGLLRRSNPGLKWLEPGRDHRSFSVYSALGIKLGKSWEACATELPKFPWTSLYTTFLELEGLMGTQEPQDRILRFLYDGSNGMKWKEFGDRDNNADKR